MMKNFLGAAFAASVATLALAPAQAATIASDDKCVSVSNPAGCLFNGVISNQASANLTAANYNLVRDPDITLNLITKSDDGDFGSLFGGSLVFTDTNDEGEGLAGTWSLPGWDVSYIAVKAGTQFVLYDVEDNQWSTSGLLVGRGNQAGLSHIAFFGTESVVPEPGTWALLIAGFGMIGAAVRRRNGKLAVA